MMEAGEESLKEVKIVTGISSNLAEDISSHRERRAECFHQIWSGPVVCERLSYFSVISMLYQSSFASYQLILSPWMVVMSFCIFWVSVTELLLPGPSDKVRENLLALEVLVTIKGGAIAFLLAFRISRTSVRFYDARSSAFHTFKVFW